MFAAVSEFDGSRTRNSSRTPSPEDFITAWRKGGCEETFAAGRLRTPSPEDSCYLWNGINKPFLPDPADNQVVDTPTHVSQQTSVVFYTPVCVPLGGMESGVVPWTPNAFGGYTIIALSPQAYPPCNGFPELYLSSPEQSEHGGEEEAPFVQSVGSEASEKEATRDLDEEDSDEVPPPPAPFSAEDCASASAGSAGHPDSCGPACKYHSKTRGCKDGVNCSHCHLCIWRSPKDRRRNSATSAAQKPLAKATSTSEDEPEDVPELVAVVKSSSKVAKRNAAKVAKKMIAKVGRVHDY